MKIRKIICVLAAGHGLMAATATAQVPELINYQGRLAQGTNLVNGSVALSLRLFDAPTLGNLLYEDSNTVTVADGLYSTFIGDNPSSSAFLNALTNAAVWVEVVVNGSTLSPRERLASVGYSLATRGILVDTNYVPNVVVLPDWNIVSTGTVAAKIGGGFGNNIGEFTVGSTIGGGVNNSIEGYCSFSVIGGGQLNVAPGSGNHATIGGGSRNSSGYAAYYTTIGGGRLNSIGYGGDGAVIGGGRYNEVRDLALNAVIGGGVSNLVGTNAESSVIAGGRGNSIQNGADHASIGGGSYNTNGANASGAAMGGGTQNSIGTGSGNATVAGGEQNSIGPNSNWGAIGGGYQNVISNDALYATIPGGAQNSVGQNAQFSLAAGKRARVLHRGTFMWADSTEADFVSTTNDQFNVRAAGGVQLASNTSIYCGTQLRQMLNLYNASYGIGVQASTLYFRCAYLGSGDDGFIWYRGGVHNDNYLGAGGGEEMMHLVPGGLYVNGVLVPSSDRNAKENFEAVNAREVLEKVAALPVARWNFKASPDQQHIGPMAQDFYAAFGVGPDDKHIATVDADGVALAAIQGLYGKNEELRKMNKELREEMNEMKATLRQAQGRLAALEAR